MPPSDADILEVDAIGARALVTDGIHADAPQRVAELIGLSVTAADVTNYLGQYRTQMSGRRKPTPFNLFLAMRIADRIRDEFSLGASATTGVDDSAGVSPVLAPDIKTKTDDGDQMPVRKIVTRPLETSDLYLSAYFLTAGAKLLETRRQGMRVTFVFDAAAHELRNSWLDMSATVPAQAYATAIKNLKHLVSQAA